MTYIPHSQFPSLIDESTGIIPPIGKIIQEYYGLCNDSDPGPDANILHMISYFDSTFSHFIPNASTVQLIREYYGLVTHVYLPNEDFARIRHNCVYHNCGRNWNYPYYVVSTLWIEEISEVERRHYQVIAQPYFLCDKYPCAYEDKDEKKSFGTIHNENKDAGIPTRLGADMCCLPSPLPSEKKRGPSTSSFRGGKLWTPEDIHPSISKQPPHCTYITRFLIEDEYDQYGSLQPITERCIIGDEKPRAIISDGYDKWSR